MRCCLISEDKGFGRFMKALKGKGVLIIMLVFGAVLLIAGGASGRGNQVPAEEDAAETLEECRDRLEGELEATLSRIDGVGVCRVTIVLLRGERAVYSGSQLLYREPAVVSAVSVSCEGGGSSAVRKEVSETVSSLYSIGSNRVSVHKLTE